MGSKREHASTAADRAAYYRWLDAQQEARKPPPRGPGRPAKWSLDDRAELRQKSPAYYRWLVAERRSD